MPKKVGFNGSGESLDGVRIGVSRDGQSRRETPVFVLSVGYLRKPLDYPLSKGVTTNAQQRYSDALLRFTRADSIIDMSGFRAWYPAKTYLQAPHSNGWKEYCHTLLSSLS